jgi:nitrite reductase/ring-hydroxylating ferredoxin subunit
MSWIQAATLEELEMHPVVVKHAPFQVLVLQSAGQVYAVDNRCPHEGYPLAEGTLAPAESVITCNWHNWKFRLSDGRCLIGGDNLRRYPVRVDDGVVLVDLARPSADEAARQIISGLRVAFDDRDFGRICREITRLDYEGIDPVQAVTSAVGWWHDRVE